MSRVVWTRSALASVRRWHDFLQEKNPEAAQRAIKLVRGSIKIISSHPEAGRPIAEMDSEYRKWVIPFIGRAFIVVYRYKHGVVQILLVFVESDCRKDFK